MNKRLSNPELLRLNIFAIESIYVVYFLIAMNFLIVALLWDGYDRSLAVLAFHSRPSKFQVVPTKNIVIRPEVE